MDIKPQKKSKPQTSRANSTVKQIKKPAPKPIKSKKSSRASSLDEHMSRKKMMADIDSSLKSIADKQAPLKATRNASRRQRRPVSRKKKITKNILLILLLVALLAVGYVGFRLYMSSDKLFGGNPFSAIFSNQKLKQDNLGRSNILIFGTSEDDPGHSGALLADSIMVLSVNQDTKEATTISIPRDLWVEYDIPCSSGQGKINATYACALNTNNNDEAVASLNFAKQVGQIVGLDIQYFAKVNYSFVRETVDALGGIDVTIDSRDPRGIYDVNTGLKLPNGVNSINGEQALQLSRARGAAGGYGLEQSNFDREQNQQAVLRAIQQKALSSGTLTNPLTALSLIDSLSANISTNVESSELRTIINVAAGVAPDTIASLPLNSKENPLVTTGSHGGQSIVRPVKGLFDYSDIQNYVKQSLSPATLPAEAE